MAAEKKGKDIWYWWAPTYLSVAERLIWVIDFIQEDLEGLDGKEPSKVLEIVTELEKYVFLRKLITGNLEDFLFAESKPTPDGHTHIFQDLSTLLEAKKVKEVLDVQAGLKAFFLHSIWPSIEFLQKLNSGQLDRESALLTPMELDGSQPYHVVSMAFKILPDDSASKLCARYEIGKKRKEEAVYHMKNLCDGLSFNTVCRCEYDECGRFFYNPTNKRKRFCSTKCNWRFNARKRREENPERYREKQREIMRERYATRKKNELGPNVKITRRKLRITK
jgi:hypothetical protein